MQRVFRRNAQLGLGPRIIFKDMLFPFIFRACPFFLPLLASVSKEKLGAGTLAHRKSQLSKA